MNSTLVDTPIEAAAVKVWVENRLIYLLLSDGRIIGFPAERFRLLKDATNEQ